MCRLWNKFILATLLALWWNWSLGACCMQGDFEAQVQCRLQHLKSPAERARAKLTCDHVQNILQTRWKDVVVSPTGSSVTGLATSASDTDCHANIPGYRSSQQTLVVAQIVEMLTRNPTLFRNVTSKTFDYGPLKVTVINLYDIVNQQDCDLNVENYTSPADSEARAYYYNLDERFLPLAALIKSWIWSRREPLAVFTKRLKFASELMTIFYLQQLGLAPAFCSLQSRHNGSRFERWDTRFHSAPHNSSSPHSLLELLGGFFRFYSQFNFRDYVISPYAGRPLHRSLFHNISTIPKEFTQYKNFLKTLDTNGSNPLVSHSPIYVMLLFEQRYNALEIVGQDIGSGPALRFISDIKFVAKMYQEIPSHMFLHHLLDREYSMNNTANTLCPVEQGSTKSNLTVHICNSLEYCTLPLGCLLDNS